MPRSERGKNKMENVRCYLEDESVSCPFDDSTASALPAGDEERTARDDETRSCPGSTRVDGRSSVTKSIGSLSQCMFESDDNEDEKYYGTCNGYDSHPGSKSNLLLCSECDPRSKTCSYRPPSNCGRFVEERIEGETKNGGGAARHQQDRRSSAMSAVPKSPVRIETSPRYFRDDGSDDRGRRSKSVPSTFVAVGVRQQEQDRQLTIVGERQRDRERREHDSRSPGTNARRSPGQGSDRSPRCREVDQRAWSRRAERDEEVREGKAKKPQERHLERRHDARSPVRLADRSPRYHEIDHRPWTASEDEVREEEPSEDPDYLKESEGSPPCPMCNGSNGLSRRCAHCNLSSDRDDGDLICFRCQMSAEEETTSVEGSVCPKCENNCASNFGTNGSCRTTSSSSEGSKCAVDAVVKIHVNNRSIEVDSDDTLDSDPSNNRDSGDAGAGSVDRLATIVEAKNDTASDNGEDNGSKINGQPRTKYLNYMIVLLL